MKILSGSAVTYMSGWKKYGRIIGWLLAAILWPGMTFPAAAGAAAAGYTNPETGYTCTVEDDAMLFSDDEQIYLQQELQELTAYGHAAVITSAAGHSSDTGEYARSLYRGLYGTESGTLFLIDMNSRMIWIFSDGAVYRTITTPYANIITDNVYRLASIGMYYECASSVIEQELTLLEGGKIAQPMKYATNALMALALSCLLCFVYVIVRRRRKVEKHAAIMAGTTITAAAVAVASARKAGVVRRKRESGSGGGGGFSGGGGGGSSGGGGGHSF